MGQLERGHCSGAQVVKYHQIPSDTADGKLVDLLFDVAISCNVHAS